MGPRKCIYTGGEAHSKDNVLPKDGETEHNWTNKAPINSEYKQEKQSRSPSELELEANRVFHLLELARLDIVFYEARLKEIQSQIAQNKSEEIEKAYHIKDLVESFEEKVEEKLTEKRKFWDED
jgi:hypothetical protein